MKYVLLFLLSFQFAVTSAQVPENPKDKNITENYSIVFASTEMENDFAMQQRDIIFENREKLKALGVTAFHVTPNAARSIYNSDISTAYNYNKYMDMMEKDATFKVILLNNKKVIKFTKTIPMTIDEILTLTTQKDSLDTVEDTTNQQMRDSRKTTKDRVNNYENNN